MSTESRSMSGKVCVITGATAGIGKETALGLAKLGATVVIVARDADKAGRTVAEISTAADNRNVEWVLGDFASLDSVRAAAAEIARHYGAIQVLVNNAGVANKERKLSADGFELTFAVNHLAPFLFTRELLPVLRAGAPSRIVNVSSGAERSGAFDFDDLQNEKNYRGFPAYARTKLMNVLFTYELAARLAGTGVTANCLHPGAVATDMLRQLPKWLYMLISPFLLTPEQGAKTTIFLASSPAVEGVSGGFYEKMKAKRSSPRSYDVDARTRLWEMSEAMLAAHASGARAPSLGSSQRLSR